MRPCALKLRPTSSPWPANVDTAHRNWCHPAGSCSTDGGIGVTSNALIELGNDPANPPNTVPVGDKANPSQRARVCAPAIAAG
jgi:hypothetical protein